MATRDHPVIQDFLATLRPFAPNTVDFDTFTHQWFFEVVIPGYRLTDAKKTAEGPAWKATVKVENIGAGTMPVELAVTRAGSGSRRTARLIAITKKHW